MATLQGKNINTTYPGLLKTFNSSPIGTGTLITDGFGCSTALTLGSTGNNSSFDSSIVVSCNITAGNDLTTNGNLCVKGAGAFDGSITTFGDTTTNGLTAGNYRFTGSGTFNGPLSLLSTLTVTGVSNLGTTNLGNAAIGGSLSVTGTVGAGPITTTGLQVNGTINSTGDIIAFSTSDSRLKDNLSPIDSENFVSNLTGYEFDWNDRSKKSGKGKGIIAQDLYKLDDSLVRENNEGYLSVDYISLIPILIEEVKRLGKEIEKLKKI